MILNGRDYLDERPGSPGSCNPVVGHHINLAPGVDDNAPSDDVWFLVYAGPTPDEIDLERPSAMFTQGGGIVGRDVCHDTIGFDEGGALAIAMRAVDRAGNESPLTELGMLSAEPDGLASCGSAAGAGGPGTLALLFGVLAWRAHRRRGP